jgi:kynurenine formamidase
VPAETFASIDAARVIDLSYPFDERTIYWPTARPFELKSDARGRTAGGYWYASSTLCASEHGGTHLDAPFHFAEAGRTTDAIPLSALIAPAVVVDVRLACAADPDHAVTLDEIRLFEARHGTIPAGAVVVLHTGWGERWPDRRAYLGDDTPGNASRLRFPGLSAEGARYLAKRKVAGVGIDTASIDPGASRDFIAHQILAAADVYNLENLGNVEQLPATGATLIALPMKIAGGTGGPARVIAILP